MKNYLFLAIAFVLLICSKQAAAQTDPASFTGAQPKLDHYDALYVLNSGDDKKIHGIIRNMNNALEDPRLKGKLHIELIVFWRWSGRLYEIG